MFQGALDGAQGGAGDLAIARGGIEFAVPQQHLDHPDVDLLFQKVRGEAVPERVQGDAFVDPGRLPGAIKGTTELAGGERIDRVLAWKQPAARQHHAPLAGRQPPGPQQVQERL